MKAKQFFGIGSPKDSATKSRNMGHTGSVQNKTGAMPNLHENVKQAASHPTPTTYQRKEKVRQVGSTGRA